ncbi:MAG TPA: hypothetical protein VG844_15625 [Terracidiphilus sp.]|nr:hypothetical protein [Terracidiphilus sp.]
MRLRTIIATMGLLSTAAFLHSQVVSPNNNAAPFAAAFGNGEAATLQYAGENVPSNEFVFSTGYQFSYDTNVLGASDPSGNGDQVHDLNAQVRFLHAGPRWNTTFEYIPYYEFYGKYTQYNRLNQHLSADITATLNPKWSLRLRDSFDDLTNPYGPGSLSGGGLGSPSSLNGTIFVPLASEQGNSSRADLIWTPNGRTNAFIFGGFETRDFSQIVDTGSSLINTQGPSGGAEYSWRSTEHTDIGMLYLFERLKFSGALPVGSPKQLDIHGFLPSFGWQVSPTVQVTAFAGPEIANQTVFPTAPSTALIHDQQVVWAGGGTVSLQKNRTSWYVTPQRIVADGGGYFSYVISTSVEAAVRQQLPFSSLWDVTLAFQAAKNEAFSAESTNLNLVGQSASVELEHPITERIIARARYNFTHQNASQGGPAGADFDRNRISLGINYQWSAAPRLRQ